MTGWYGDGARSGASSRPGGTALLEWPSEHDNLDYSADPRVTRHDVWTALGPDADRMMTDANIDVDELIRLVNAETTMLPPIVVPDAPSNTPAPGDSGKGRAKAAKAAKAKAAQFRADHGDGLATAVRTWKSRFLKGAVLAVLITLTGGGAAALAMNKSVTVEVDGERDTVRSFGDTVGEVLDDAGIEVGKHDALSPSPQAPVGDGGVIQVERGRQLHLTVDGQQQQAWVRATTVGEALTQLGLDELNRKGTQFSAPVGAEIPLDGMTLEIKTRKAITLFDGGNKPRELTTNAVTAAELLAELNLKLGPDDHIEGGRDFRLLDGADVRISRTGVSVINVKETVDPPVRKIEDPELEAGKEIVEEEGKPGEELVTYRVTKRNGDEVDREELSSKVTTKPRERVVRIGTKQPEIADGAVWDALAQCESGGNWSINTGNGYYGGVQFDKQTWDAYGGSEYAAYPHEASREQQIDIASRVRDDRGGYGAWPSCSSQLGLPK